MRMKPVVVWALGLQDCWCSISLTPGDAAGDAAGDAELALHKAEGCVGTQCELYEHGLLVSAAGCTCWGSVGPLL